MTRAVSRLFKRVAVAAVGAFALCWVLFLALMIFTALSLVFPTRVGPHREFFKICADIPEDASIPAVLERMRGYTFVRRSETRPVNDALLASHPLPDLDSYGRGPSFLFFPSPQDKDDWCVVYLRQNQVVRTQTFRSHLGSHRRFFETCVAIPEDASIPEVLERMRGYTFVRRLGTLRVTDVLLASHPRPTPSSHGESSFLFHPNPQDTGDSCAVYFRQGQVVRTRISPD